MKKILVGCIVFAFFGLTGTLHATVGGQNLIDSFAYNPEDESVYYVEQNFGGRGCPPELFKVSLTSGKVGVVVSCDNDRTNSSPEISAIIENFKKLTPLNFKKNNITIDLSFVRVENYSAEYAEVLTNHFRADVYQNGQKVADFPVQGCSTQQPFIFQGYSIPGLNKKIIILVSTKENCFEGGYIGESLHTVGGVEVTDKTPVNFYKTLSPLLPNEGNYVVYEEDKPTVAVSTVVSGTDTVPPVFQFGVMILLVLIAFFLGMGAHFLFKKK